jgi:hypothetical protein
VPTTRLRAPRPHNAILPAVLLLVVAACGSTAPSATPATGSADPSGASPGASAVASPTAGTTAATAEQIDGLREAALASVDEGTVRLVYTVEFDGATTVPDGVFLTGRGQTSFGEPRRTYLSADMRNQSFGDWEMWLDERELFLKGDVVRALVPADRWLLVNLDSNHRLVGQFASLASGQNDTSLALFYVLGASGDVQTGVGESIDGSDTTRYVLDIDLATVGERAPAESGQAIEDNLAALEASGISPVIEAEVWVGTSGRILRTRYVYTLGSAEGGGKLIGTYTFGDYGAAMDVATPPDAQVIPLEEAVAS